MKDEMLDQIMRLLPLYSIHDYDGICFYSHLVSAAITKIKDLTNKIKKKPTNWLLKDGKEAFLSKNLRNDKSKRPFIKETEKHFSNTSHAEFIRFNSVKTHDYKNHLHVKHPILSYWIILQ